MLVYFVFFFIISAMVFMITGILKRIPIMTGFAAALWLIASPASYNVDFVPNTIVQNSTGNLSTGHILYTVEVLNIQWIFLLFAVASALITIAFLLDIGNYEKQKR